jgi:hypothetical protein
LDEILEEMILAVESQLWISVEDGYDGNSFWISTPDDHEGEYWPSAGIIELDINNKIFTKIVSLAHEVGHYFLEKDKDFGIESHKMFEESLAWYLGYKYFENKGFVIDIKEYKKEASKCLGEYVRSLNEQDDN